MAALRGEMGIKTSKIFEVEQRAIQVQKEFPENFGSDLATDEQVIREACQSGPCLKKVSGENLVKLYKKLLENKARFGQGGADGTYGESRTKVGPSCSMIKKLTGMNVNGF